MTDYLISNTGALNVTKSEVFSSIGKLIASKNFPEISALESMHKTRGQGCLLLWLVIGIGIILLIIFGKKRRKKKNNSLSDTAG